jgi:murein DD-endopeptidase MepM/ murein hydrolase activator NlpD
MRAVALLLLAVVAGVAWYARDAPLLRIVRGVVTPPTPHAAYRELLTRTGLAATAPGRQWIEAAARAVDQPLRVRLPFERSALHTPERPSALGYRVTLKRGQRVEVLATFDGETPTQTFVDVFPAGSDAQAGEAGSLRATIFEPDRDADVILRVQPELHSNGRLRVVARAVPALQFPVANARPDALKSVFGDARDGGRRHHEGVDIFARRGTAVLSASHGIVTRVNETDIGGRVVWVWDPSRSLTLYYAHLDTQLVTAGQRVRRGDVIGTIGNTGNARTTAPHLHFGIYESGTGAIDPHTFIAG